MVPNDLHCLLNVIGRTAGSYWSNWANRIYRRCGIEGTFYPHPPPTHTHTHQTPHLAQILFLIISPLIHTLLSTSRSFFKLFLFVPLLSHTLMSFSQFPSCHLTSPLPLFSLLPLQGPQGDAGPPGATGGPGPNGPNGLPGRSGPIGQQGRAVRMGPGLNEQKREGGGVARLSCQPHESS